MTVGSYPTPAPMRQDPYNKYVSQFGQDKKTWREMMDYDYIGRIKDFFGEFFWGSVMGDYTAAIKAGTWLGMAMAGLPPVQKIPILDDVISNVFGEKTKSNTIALAKSLRSLVGEVGSFSIQMAGSALKTPKYASRMIRDLFILVMDKSKSGLSKSGLDAMSKMYKTDNNYKTVLDTLSKKYRKGDSTSKLKKFYKDFLKK